MNLDEMLPPGGLDALAAQLDVPQEQARSGAQALLPALLGGMGDNADRLDAEVSSLGGPGLAANVVGAEPTNLEHGKQLLGGIFGSKDVSRKVAGHAAESSGLDPALLKKMLPNLVMLVAGHLSGRSGGQSGGLGGILGSVLGSLGDGTGSGGMTRGSSPGGLGGILGSILGGSR